MRRFRSFFLTAREMSGESSRPYAALLFGSAISAQPFDVLVPFGPCLVQRELKLVREQVLGIRAPMCAERTDVWYERSYGKESDDNSCS